MKPLHDLEKSAQQRRLAFKETFQSLKSQIAAPHLLVDGAVLSAAWLFDKYLGSKHLKLNHKPKNQPHKQENNHENRNRHDK
jgi:hypothetical protein